MIHGFRFRGVDERPFTVRRRHVADTLFDLRFDLGVLFHPCPDLLVAAVRVFGLLHFAEHQLSDQIIFTESVVILDQLRILPDESLRS